MAVGLNMMYSVGQRVLQFSEEMLVWMALRTGNILQLFHLPRQNFIEQSQWKRGRYIRVLIARCITWYSSSVTLQYHDASSGPWGDIVEWRVRFEFLNRAASPPCLALAVKCASVIAFTLQRKAVLKLFASLYVYVWAQMLTQ